MTTGRPCSNIAGASQASIPVVNWDSSQKEVMNRRDKFCLMVADVRYLRGQPGKDVFHAHRYSSESAGCKALEPVRLSR